MTTDRIDTTAGGDPSDLPLFATVPAQRPGRVRGSFSMTPTPTPTVSTHLGNDAVVAGAELVSRPLPRPFAGELDWPLVAALRQRASDRLSAVLGEDRTRTTGTEQRDRGRAIILDLLEAEAEERIGAGVPTWSATEQDALVSAVDNALFGLGRLQPLVDDDTVENIIITGHDQVTLELSDGRLVPGPDVADSDQELIDFLVFLASRSEVNARPFSQAQPRLHLRLDGGARLAAAAWVTPRPSVVIRRHRLRRITLDDLVGLGTLSDVAASFLSAAVKARRSIVVAGAQGAGKTTLVRALCAEIPKHEAIGTFETEYELHLHELRDQHPIVFAWEARPGSGEHGPGGSQAGEFTLSQALFDSFRFNLSRQIVGEVRGHEILAMLKAMESGAGSISTTHAPSAEGAIAKLVTCAMEAGPHVTHDYAVRAIAAAIDVVVHVHLETAPSAGGVWQRHRWVAEIITLTSGEKDKGYAIQHVFRTHPGERQATPHVLDDSYRDLTRYGFDLEGFFAATRGPAS